MKSWVVTLALVAAYLLFCMSVCEAGWIFDVNGVMAPTLANSASASFTGELEFTSETSTEGELRINLTNEYDPNTLEPYIRTAPFQMSANLSTPIGQRIFSGTYNETPFAMQWIDYSDNAELNFIASDLDTVGWDAMAISFSDYQLGTITDLYNKREVPQVNEPGGLALLIVGFCAVAGYMRPRTSNQ